MRPRNPTTGSAEMRDWTMRHPDGRRVRVFVQSWRDGFDPRNQGLVRVVIQPVILTPCVMVDACHALFDQWTFPDAVGDRVEAVLGPGWKEERRAA